MNAKPLAGIGVLVAGAIVTWWFLAEQRGPPRALESLGPAPSDARAGDEILAARGPIASTESIPSTESSEPASARLFLAEYWGPRWSEIEAALVAEGLDLDAPFEVKPWEEVAPAFEAGFRLTEARREEDARMILAWPDEEPIEAFATKLAEQYALRPLEEQDALAVQEIAAPYNRELSVLAAEYNEAIDQAFQERFRSGTFVKAPFATHGVTRPEDLGGFYTKLSSMGGWHTIVSLRSEDYPYLMDLRDRAQQLVERRDLDVKRALRERGY